MLLPDEIDQMIDQKTTDALERLPRILDHRSALNGQSEPIVQQKQTNTLLPLRFDTSDPTVTWWEARQFREENEYLHSLLEQQHAKMQQLTAAYSKLKGEFDREITSIHHSHQQETEYYQQHLQEVGAERDRLYDAHEELENRYQELFHNFQEFVEEEAQRKILEATQTVTQSPEKAPVLFQNLVKALEVHFRQEEDKHLVEALYLKREVYRMAQLLEQERQQLKAEYQQLFTQQYSIRKQAELQQKTLRARLYARWKMVSVLTSLGLLILLVVLQFLFLSFFHVHLTSAASLSIIAPIILCALLALVLATSASLVKHMHLSAPRKKMIKKSA